MQPYDFVYGMEGARLTPKVGVAQFGEAKTQAFASKGAFDIWVYNFQVRALEREYMYLCLGWLVYRSCCAIGPDIPFRSRPHACG